MTNDEGSTNARMPKTKKMSSRDSDFVINSSSVIRHSSLTGDVIASASQLSKLIEQIAPASRVAIDTEADSLHSYREKLCLLQLSVSGKDYIVDPLADIDLAPLREALEPKEIVLHSADYDLRMLRRGIDFTAQKIFDTVIAARLLGIREFSLAALVRKYFAVELPKGSQKANWAKRPLPGRMAEYALNDVHYLLRLADRLEDELDLHHRLDWFRQSCQRAIEQAAADRVRDEDEIWRIRGAGALRERAAAVLRALWQWREAEAEAVDRPAFHILQNEELLRSAEAFAAGSVPDYRHFSERRRRAFREAAEKALQLPENEWPIWRRGFGNRPTSEMLRRTDELRQRRDHAAHTLKIEPAFIAPRATLEAIATERDRAETLLVPWQRELLEV
jgi:ribonuclease D